MASALLVHHYCRTYFVNPLLRFGCTVMPARFHPAATKISTTIWMARWMISLLLEESGARASFARTAHTGCNKAVFKSAKLAISFALLLLIDELLWMIIGRTPSCYMSVHELRLLSFITSVRAWARSRRGAGEVNEFAICSTSGAAKIQLFSKYFRIMINQLKSKR